MIPANVPPTVQLHIAPHALMDLFSLLHGHLCHCDILLSFFFFFGNEDTHEDAILYLQK